MKKKYKTRIADEILKKRLQGKGAVLIEGPKWCGKTTTAEQIAGSILYMADPEKEKQNLALAEINPKRLLIGEIPRLIDEWQIAPKLWDAIRFEIDHRDEFGQFILTGSAVPASYEHIHHTGTGRFSWLLMRPMSLYESGDSSGQVSLEQLFDAPEQIDGENPLDLNRLAFLVCRGGWPRSTDLDGELALEQAFDYYDAVVKSDISRADGVTRNPERVKRLMRSYARNQGSQATNTLICQDIAANDAENFDADTVYSYISALKKIFVIEEMEAWNPNIRSKTAIRTSNTRYFVDPSIAVASLGLGPQDLMEDLNTFGLLFEGMCIRDLRVFADALHGTVYHFRDKTDLECDAVIHLRNGSYGLVEIKLGGDSLVEEGAENLKKLRDKIDTTKMKSPSFLMVMVGVGDFAYRRQDEVYIVPAGCLKN
ncbi:MAG: ATP-binding protein [Lachnospiraceae bacterium]|nr:ATP-binding protein [Lachnospiraceae bacterium]